MKDEIVEKLHEIREKAAKEFNYDIDAMFDDLREKQEQQAKNGRKIVSFAKKTIRDKDDKKAA